MSPPRRFALALSFAAAASAAVTRVCVSADAAGAFSASPPPCAGALAWASLDASLNATGWHVLDVAANASAADGVLAAGAAGFAEGFLLADQMFLFASNTGALDANSRKLQKFLDENLAFMDAQLARAWPAPRDAAYWGAVNETLAQLRGSAAGAAAAGAALSFADVYNAVIQGGDIFNLVDVYGASRAQLAAGRGAARAAARAAARGVRGDHCSAVVRLLPGAADIVAGHATWSPFENMLRVLKRYDLPGAAGAPPPPGRTFSLSGYPGLLSYSSDDFYVVASSGLIALETTIDNDNKTLAVEFASTNVVLEWLRNVVANRLATSGAAWAELFSRYASGTYTNSWMIVDTNLFTPGAAPPPGTLTVVEEMPGHIRVHDRTATLAGDGFWPSYNVASDPFIFIISGQQALVDEYGGADGPGAFFTFANTSRANIFRRDAPRAGDAAAVRALLRSNNFKTDPLARLACGVAPPYSATNAIADRSDLNVKKGDYKVPSLGHGDSAAIDAKVASAAAVRAARAAGRGEAPFAAVSGPTISESCPEFTWDTAAIKAEHVGLPDAFAFPWVSVFGA